MKKVFFIVIGLLSTFLFLSLTLIQKHELIQIGTIGHDPYGRDCAGGISIAVTNASVSKEYIGRSAFIKPTLDEFKMPDGLIASGNNKLEFYGHFEYIDCIHLMGDEKSGKQLFFCYDSVAVYCPYKIWNLDKMKFDTIECGRHSSFNKRIRVIK